MKKYLKKELIVDIILPNYNGASSIKRSINSVISQSFKNWKLFIIDDGSKDNSKKIINKFKNININKIYLNRNRGVSYCRNLGIKKSKSKYIAFIDSDDYWTKNKLREQIKFMEKFYYKFTYSDYTPFKVVNKKKIIKKKINSPVSFTYNKFINNTTIAMSTVVIHRSILGKIKFKNFTICEDYLFKCELLKKNKIANKINKITMFYQISKNSKQSNKLKNIYWIWYINKKYNKLSSYKNLKSVICIIFNSIKKYGFK